MKSQVHSEVHNASVERIFYFEESRTMDAYSSIHLGNARLFVNKEELKDMIERLSGHYNEFHTDDKEGE